MRGTIEKQLAEYIDPYLQKNLQACQAIKNIEVQNERITVDICLPYPFASVKNKFTQSLQSYLQPIVLNKDLHINFSAKIDAHTGQQTIKALPNIKNIIVVASGKGGVGKSTIALNLALALHQEGARCGLLDADIYGPSQPAMLGTEGVKPQIKDNAFLPIEKFGLQTMSIGYLVEGSVPLAWRGPMLGKALQQLLQDTRWENLDYLVVDLPPGTGDVQLTLCQKIPVSGAVIVTTPQDLALHDVRRAYEMFTKLNVPVLGVVENMSYYACLHCGNQEPIFGVGGGARLAQDYALPLLGSLPLAKQIRESADQGAPIVAQDANIYALEFAEIARKVGAGLALQPKDYSAKFPKIVKEIK